MSVAKKSNKEILEQVSVNAPLWRDSWDAVISGENMYNAFVGLMEIFFDILL